MHWRSPYIFHDGCTMQKLTFFAGVVTVDARQAVQPAAADAHNFGGLRGPKDTAMEPASAAPSAAAPSPDPQPTAPVQRGRAGRQRRGELLVNSAEPVCPLYCRAKCPVSCLVALLAVLSPCMYFVSAVRAWQTGSRLVKHRQQHCVGLLREMHA